MRYLPTMPPRKKIEIRIRNDVLLLTIVTPINVKKKDYIISIRKSIISNEIM